MTKLLVPSIRSCLRTQLNQNMEYEIITSEIIIVRYISSVFVAPIMWKTSAIGEISAEIYATHMFSCAGTKITHEWVTSDCLICNHGIVLFILLSHDSQHVPAFLTPQKIIRVEEPDNSVSKLGKNGHFQSVTHGVTISKYFQPNFFRLYYD